MPRLAADIYNNLDYLLTILRNGQYNLLLSLLMDSQRIINELLEQASPTPTTSSHRFLRFYHRQRGFHPILWLKAANILAGMIMDQQSKLYLSEIDTPVANQLQQAFNEVNFIPKKALRRSTVFGKADKQPLGEERVFIVSDLHLAGRGILDRFHKMDKFIRFLKVIHMYDGVLIINGDFFDLWRTDLSSILLKYREILWEFMRIKRIILLVGNHDNWFENFTDQKLLLPNISVLEYFWDPELRIFIEHGHQADYYNSTFIGHAIVKLLTLLETITKVRWAEMMDNIRVRITSQRQWYKEQVIWVVHRIQQVLNEFTGWSPANPQRTSFIFGHSHHQRSRQVEQQINELLNKILPSVEFYNSAGWVLKEPRFLLVEKGNIHRMRLKTKALDMDEISKELSRHPDLSPPTDNKR